MQRSILELLVLLSNQYKKDIEDKTDFGLCAAYLKLEETKKITLEERVVLDTYLDFNEPEDAEGAFWYDTEETAKRIEWLDYHINFNA